MRYTNPKWIVVKCSGLAKQFTVNTPCDYSAVDIKMAPDKGRGQPNVFTAEKSKLLTDALLLLIM
jgi:hypothetical protein